MRFRAAERVAGAMRKAEKTNFVCLMLWWFPTPIYRCECWTIQRRHESKLQAFEMVCLRRVEVVAWRDRVRNVVVREALGQNGMIQIVRLEQMREDRLVNRVCIHGRSKRKKVIRKAQKKKAGRSSIVI